MEIQKEMKEKKFDLNVKKLRGDLDLLVKKSDPMFIWLPILEDVKSILIDAKGKDISLKKIHFVFKENGVNIPMILLKQYVETYL